MSNYSSNPNSCRVDFFKSSGKWYATKEVEFSNSTYDNHPIDALKTALKHPIGDRYGGMNAVCLHPYCASAFPVMLQIDFN